jgi:predicted Zn-dependent protease
VKSRPLRAVAAPRPPLPPGDDAVASRPLDAVAPPPHDAAAPPPLDAAAEPPAATPPVETADDVYARAEAAMRAGDRPTACALLTELVRRFPTHALADSALYELARLAAAEQPERAHAYLDQLLARGIDPTLLEPARFLRCRLELDAGREAPAARCLDAFRRDFPSSSHDAEALAQLIGLAQARFDCRTTQSRIDEYLRRYPAGPFAREARERRARCDR